MRAVYCRQRRHRMRIGIDGRLVSYRRGIGNFVYNLLGVLAEMDSKHEYIVYVDSATSCKQILEGGSFRLCPFRRGNYIFSEQWTLPALAARDRLDILHCPANTAPLRVPGRTQLVLTIHDVMYLLPKAVLPHSQSLYQRMGRIYRRLIVPRVAKRAAIITTDSSHSASDIVSYLHLPSEKVRVIHGAANKGCRVLCDMDRIDQVKRAYGIRGRFVLTLGGIDPRKNTAGVIRAFGRFKQLTGLPHQLLVVGLPTNGRRRFANLGARMGLGTEVIFTSFLPEDHLIALYNGAEVFLYPSLYEGFGLPVLEAMACGTPVISSPRSSIPEIAGGAALLVSPTDIDALAGALTHLIREDGVRKEMVARGFEQASKFSWEKTAREIVNVYEECAVQ